MKARWTIWATVLVALTIGTPAAAKVTAAEAAKLGKDLTPLGATVAGNESGSIPAWEGGITKPPDDYQPGRRLSNPFANDKPLLTITSDNFRTYEANLSPGQIALFERYPETFRMPVYPSRRTASLPQRIYDRTIANATTAMLTEDGNGVMKAGEGIPFPVPNNGLEAIWNHLMRYRGKTMRLITGQATPTPEGDYVVVHLKEDVLWEYHQPGATTETVNNVLSYFLQEVMSPPRLAGQFILVQETLNQATGPRKAWSYNPGLRRVRRAPNIAYDNAGTASDGQRTNDQHDMFNGAPDRYDWTLVGKQELYIPYNSYKLYSDRNTVKDIMRPGHMNPDLTRYELHRVWVVEATLKDGTRHIYARRTFYIDEDSWQVAIVDYYDGRDQIWRISEGHVLNFYNVPLVWALTIAVYDVQNGRYIVNGLPIENTKVEFDVPMKHARFTPQALRKLGRR